LPSDPDPPLTVRLRRRFTSDTAGYWVQLFTLGSVTEPTAASSSPVGRSGKRQLLTLPLIFRADDVCADAPLVVVRTWTTTAVFVSSSNSSVHVLVGLTRVFRCAHWTNDLLRDCRLLFYWRHLVDWLIVSPLAAPLAALWELMTTPVISDR